MGKRYEHKRKYRWLLNTLKVVNFTRDKLKHTDNVILHLAQWQKSKCLVTSLVGSCGQVSTV